MKILRGYVLREHVGPFIGALSVLTGLMLLNQLARRFGDLLGKGLPWYVIAEVFGLSIPFILAMVIPMAVLVAALYTFGQLTGDNEVTAFKASGVSLLSLMLPVLIVATLVAGGMVWFNDAILPNSNHALRKLLSDIGRKRPTFELRERVVNEVIPGKLFLKAARIDRMRSVLQDMVIFDLQRPNVQRTIYADSGYMAFNEGQTDLYLTLFDGSMHEIDTRDPGTDQSTYYSRQVIRVPEVSNELERGHSGDWRGDREMNLAMMRAQVEEQRQRLGESRDSLEALLAAVRPVRALPDTSPGEPDSARATPAIGEFAKRTLEDKDTQEGEGDVSGERVAADEPRATPAAQGDSLARDASERKTDVQMENLRRRYRRPGAAVWPPAGDAILFASQIRSRFERVASRMELQQREMNKYEVEIEKKFAIPAAAIVFILIGAPVAVRFPRGGIGMVIGVSLVVFCVYYIFLIGGEDFADRDLLSPFWAMWAPNAIFTVLGFVLLYLVTLGGTTRASLTRLVPAYGRARLAAAQVVSRARFSTTEPLVATEPAIQALQKAVDLNTAAPEELAQLPGVDLERANSIVRWRVEHGQFEQLEDLLALPWMDPAQLRDLEGLVTQGRRDA